MLKAYILACLAVATSIPLKLHSGSHLSTLSKRVPSFHFTKPGYCFPCIGRCIPTLIFCVVKDYKKCQPCNASAQSTPSIQSYFVHSIQSHPCPILLYPSIPLKETKYACGRFFHFDAFRSGRSLLASTPDPFTPLHLHSISHLSSKSKSAAHPCPESAYPHHSAISNIRFFINGIIHIPKK
jgi:hypothetical protein